MQTPDEDPRSAFVRHLPRKIVEIKATLGAVLADPRQLRMRDELRRRVDAVLTIARTHQLRSLCDGLQATSDALTEARGTALLSRPQLDRLTALVASLSARAELDTRDPGAPGVRAMAIPSSSRSDQPATRTLIPGAALAPGAPSLHDLARAVTGRTTDSLVPARSPTTHGTQVLFVGSSIRASALLDALGQTADVALAQTADEAINRARDAAPDVVVAEDDSPYDGVSLAAVVAADPLVRFIPVLVIACDGEPAAVVRARCPEAFDVLESDASAEVLRARIHRALHGSASLPPATAHELGELTLDELIRALQEELRRGLGGAALPASRGARVALGAGNEVLAATWEAIARIRSVVERRSGGTVRFDLPITPRGLHGAEVFAPGALSESASAGEPSEDPLPGRRALVVDDDPSVVAVFADLLRGAGMIVSAHTDGEQALASARIERPDVVLADILMPGLDGFALCRAIRRDVALRHTPVILLSWREDLLVRMRELGAQASGYLRKEAEGSAVLARVRSTLRGRVRTLKRIGELATGAEVRGRLERVGSVALIEATAKTLGDATISLADSGSVTELEIRQGALLSAVRTAQDGSFARGEAALARALGLNAARFVVRRASHVVRENLTGKLSEVLDRSARSVTALEEAVSGASLLEVLRVEFDAEEALEYARSLPTPLRVAVERMVQGDAPRDMVLRDGLAPQDLEPLLIELSRRGAIQRVVGRNREDLAAPRPLRAPKETSGTWEHLGVEPAARSGTHEPVTKATRPMSRVATVDTLADAVWRELRDSVEEPPRPARVTSPGVAAPEPSPPDAEVRWEVEAQEPRVTRSLVPITPPTSEPEAPAEPTAPPPDEVEELSSSALMVVRPSEAPEMLPATEGVHALETRRPTGDEEDSLAPSAPRMETQPAPAFEPPPASVEAPVEPPPPAAVEESPEPSAPLPELEESASDPAFDLVVHRASRPAEAPSEEPEAAVEKPAEEPSPSEPVAEPAALELPDLKTSSGLTPSGRPAPVAAPEAPKPATTSTTSQSTSTTPEEPSWTRPMLLMVGVAAALALSYLGVRWYLASDAHVPPSSAPTGDVREAPRDLHASSPAPSLVPALSANLTASDNDPIQPQLGVPTGPAPMVTVNGPYREASRFLDGGALPPGRGLLVIPGPRRPGSPIQVSIASHPVGTAPLQRVLREGFYPVHFRAGDTAGTYFIVVRRSLAAVLSTPFDR
ncbi:MAG: response regulator [Deltaproteobacteria bacterium]|nr:response regulator [Deltaproteobacteria bacterium]